MSDRHRPRPAPAEPETAGPSEAMLIRLAQRGNRSAFEGLYRRHVSAVYGLCLRLVADPVEAETLTQDVFVRAWQKIGSYQARGPFGGWLRRVTVNLVAEARRTAARRRQVVTSLEAFTEREADGEADGNLADIGRGGRTDPVDTETAIDLDRAIRRLPEGARMAFVLHDVMGYRHQDVAELTGLAVGTIKAQLHRARRLLRILLSRETGERETR